MLFCGSRRIRESAAEAKPTRERNKIPKREIKKDKPSSFFLTGKKKYILLPSGHKRCTIRRGKRDRSGR
jgi:hypothetical protein